ncbi:MAG: hypothetical protein HC895_11065 [Leptolyngbyaceae cyanobacterium SM1_3_5]|nr:hypothetical protein [Leptolyngbyaceae cyanobacterium SM1_3_5]
MRTCDLFITSGSEIIHVRRRSPRDRAQLLPPQRLSKIEELVFRQTWDGQSYQEIAKTSGYGVGYIKDTGSKLWRSLSEALGVKVTKFNFRVVLQQKQAIASAPKPTADWGEAIDVSPTRWH